MLTSTRLRSLESLWAHPIVYYAPRGRQAALSTIVSFHQYELHALRSGRRRRVLKTHDFYFRLLFPLISYTGSKSSHMSSHFAQWRRSGVFMCVYGCLWLLCVLKGSSHFTPSKNRFFKRLWIFHTTPIIDIYMILFGLDKSTLKGY